MAKRIHKLDKILRKTLKKMDLDAKLEGYRVWLLWGDIVGDKVAKRTHPERLRNGILFVKVSSSTWMHQLQMMKPMVLEKIHKTIKGAVITDIRFFLGEIIHPARASSEAQPHTTPPEIGLSAEMEGCLDQIGDSELKALMRSILQKQAEKSLRGGGA